MKFRKQVAWLLAAPAACLSGCMFGPVHGLKHDSGVVSLQTPNPLSALERSTSIAGTGADADAFSTADLAGLDASDPDGFRLLQLASARRRANQQMMMQMMMMQPLVTPAPRPPQHRSGTTGPSTSTAQGKSSPPGHSPSPAGRPASTTASAAPSRTSPPVRSTSTALAGRPAAAPRPRVPAAPPVAPNGMNPYALSPAAMADMAAFMPPNRRQARQERVGSRPERTQTAATVEADRIERAAAAEAERAEKAALAEAMIAEKRLIAEAELVERMTRAETELAERLAAAKDERDRRIEIARQERELRMAILGLDVDELGKDPVEDALAKLNKSKTSSDESSAFTRFTRFLRTRGDDSGTRSGSRTGDDDSGIRTDRISEDLLIDKRTLAEKASRLPSEASEQEDRQSGAPVRSVADSRETAERSTGPTEFLHPSLLGNRPISSPRDDDRSDSRHLAVTREATDWETPSRSLLDDIRPDPRTAERDTGGRTNDRNLASTPPEFPDAIAASPRIATPVESASDRSDRRPSLLEDEPEIRRESIARGNSERRRPEDDIWILGGAAADRDRGNEDSSLAAAAAEVSPFPETSDTPPYRPERYTEPGGLFARPQAPNVDQIAETRSPTLADNTWVLDRPEQVRTSGQFPSEGVAEDGDAVDPAFAALARSGTVETAQPDRNGSSDPWLDTSPLLSSQAAQVASEMANLTLTARAAAPSPVAIQPTGTTSIQQTAWQNQSLLDVCGQLPEDLRSLVLQLDIPEAGIRKDVLHDLGQMGSRARPALPAVRVLLDDHPLIAAHAAWTIWNITSDEREVTRELVRLLQTGQPEVVQFSAYALGSLGPKALDAAPALQVERERFNGATRVHVAEALTRIDAFDEASVQILISSLDSRDPQLRWLGALALGHVQGRHADVVVPALVKALQDTDSEVRSAAALSLGGFGKAAEPAIAELQRRATLDAPSVREAAQTALACIRR